MPASLDNELRLTADRDQLFSAVVESSQDAIITKTLSGMVTGWNKAAERMFGYSAAEAIGKHVNIIVPPDRQDEVRTILDRIGKDDPIKHFETVRLSKDGRHIHVSLSVSPVKSASGEIVGAAKVARDITDSKEAKDALEREAAERRQVVEMLTNTIMSMTDAVMVSDIHGRVVHSNPAARRLIGIDPGTDPFWQRPRDIFEPDGLTSVPLERRPLIRAIRGEKVDGMEIVVRRHGKASRLIANGGPLMDHANRITGAVVVYRDITGVRETERQLQQAQKMEAVGELTGGIAHDFNNILTVITGTIEILADAVAHDPGLVAIAKMIDDAASRGADLTQRLLAFARRQPLQPRETDINALVIEVAQLLRPTLGEHIEIDSMLRDKLHMALIDPTQLTTAIINLAINSRDAMPSGGKLTVETENVYLDDDYAKAHLEVRAGPYVMIAVSDTGSGIPASIQEKVFEPFFTTKDVGRGSGLGLSMVYGFVKQSGGHIKIYSEDGLGTCIKMYLPRCDGSEQAEPEVPIDAMAGGTETILIVEDDHLVRKYVATQLESLGYRVLTAVDAISALNVVGTGQPFDLLFTDVVMPGDLNGRKLSEEVLKRRPSTKVLFTSGYTENAIVHHGRLDPGVLLLAKPYRKRDLARMIRQAINAR